MLPLLLLYHSECYTSVDWFCQFYPLVALISSIFSSSCYLQMQRYNQTWTTRWIWVRKLTFGGFGSIIFRPTGYTRLLMSLTVTVYRSPWSSKRSICCREVASAAMILVMASIARRTSIVVGFFRKISIDVCLICNVVSQRFSVIMVLPFRLRWGAVRWPFHGWVRCQI